MNAFWRQRIGVSGIGVIFLIASGCGYSLRPSEIALLKREGVRKVFVAPVVNNSFRPGIENVVYNQILRTIAPEGKLELVRSLETADAVLETTVGAASFSPSGTTTTSNLFPVGKVAGITGSSSVLIASEFVASLQCSFSLRKVRAKGGSEQLAVGGVIWSGGFSRSKPFPANNQLGPFGTTSALINESENDRATRDLAALISLDMHDSLGVSF